MTDRTPVRPWVPRWLRRARRELRFLLALRALPPSVAWFQLRARWTALRTGDEFSLGSSTRPSKLATLLGAAEGRLEVVELGTATGWTALSLVLADPRRSVTSLDVIDYPQRARYEALVSASARLRTRFRIAPAEDGPEAGADRAVDLLYIDSFHDRDGTVNAYRAWEPALAPHATVVFDDFGHPDFPGVAQAINDLGLAGEDRGGLFIHRAASRS